MTKLQLLNRALTERLMAALEEIMGMVGGTVLEYEEETVRARKENEILRRRLRWMEGETPTDWPGQTQPSPVSVPVEITPTDPQDQITSQAQASAPELQAIKTEPIEVAVPLPVSADANLRVSPHNTDLQSVNPGIDIAIDSVITDTRYWESPYSYMAPLDHDPTLPTRVRRWRGRVRSQKMSFACPMCGKVFARESRLVLHMRIHSSDRPYAYRQRKACFYGDRKQKKNRGLRGQPSRESVDEWSDFSEQTEMSESSAVRSMPTIHQQAPPTSPAPDHLEAGPVSVSSISGHKVGRNGPHSNKALSNQSQPVPSGVKSRRGGEEYQGKVFPCTECDKTFPRSSWLAFHMKTHSKQKPSKMSTDKTVPKNQKVEEQHFQCPRCDKSFSRKPQLKFHMRAHLKEKLQSKRQRKEPLDDADGTQKKNQHVPCEASNVSTDKTVTKSRKVEEKRFQCPKCDKRFSRIPRLKFHMKTHWSKKLQAKPQRKELSDRELPQKKNTVVQTEPSKRSDVEERSKKRKNLKKEESGERAENAKIRFQCQHCEKSFPRENWLALHMKTHRKQPNFRHRDKRRDEGGETQTRKPRVHTEPSKRRVGNTFKRNKQAEVQKKHLKCPHCEKAFSRRAWLILHMKAHSKQKLRAGHKQKVLVDDNEKHKTSHLHVEPPKGNLNEMGAEGGQVGQKIFQCQHCEKSFPRAYWLVLHNKVHSKEKLNASYKDKDRDKCEERQMGISPVQESLSGSTEDVTAGRAPAESRKNSFPCPQCHRVFTRGAWLKQHLYRHANKTSREEGRRSLRAPAKVTCDSRVDQMTQRSRIQPSEGKLREPKVKEDEGEDKEKKTFPCPKCGRVFIREGWLAPHIRSHDKEKPKEGEVVVLERIHDVKRTTRSSRVYSKSSDIPENKNEGGGSGGKIGHFQCKQCNQVFDSEIWWKVHMRIHACEKLKAYQQETRNETLDTQLSEGNPSEPPVKESVNRMGKLRVQKGSFPCPLCGKVFPWEMRLMLHMQIHSGEKPYLYRQRKEQFYGDLTKRKTSSIHTQEPSRENSEHSDDLSDSACEETEKNYGKSEPTTSQEHTSEPIKTSQPHMVSTDPTVSPLPQNTVTKSTSIASSLSEEAFDIEPDSTATSCCNLQPRIVLQSIISESKYWKAGLGSVQENVSSEISDLELPKTSDQELVDAAVISAEHKRINSCNVTINSLEIPDASGGKQTESPDTGNIVAPETTDPPSVCADINPKASEPTSDVESVSGVSEVTGVLITKDSLQKPSCDQPDIGNCNLDISSDANRTVLPQTADMKHTKDADTESIQKDCQVNNGKGNFAAKSTDTSTFLKASNEKPELCGGPASSFTASNSSCSVEPADVVVSASDTVEESKYSPRGLPVDSATSDLIESETDNHDRTVSSNAGSVLLATSTDPESVSNESRATGASQTADPKQVEATFTTNINEPISSGDDGSKLLPHSENSNADIGVQNTKQLGASEKSMMPVQKLTNGAPADAPDITHPSKPPKEDAALPDLTSAAFSDHSTRETPPATELNSGNAETSCSVPQSTDLTPVVAASPANTSDQTDSIDTTTADQEQSDETIVNQKSALGSHIESSTPDTRQDLSMHGTDTDLPVTTDRKPVNVKNSNLLSGQTTDSEVEGESIPDDMDCEFGSDGPNSGMVASNTDQVAVAGLKPSTERVEGKRLFRCKLCSKVFDQEILLTEHIEEHRRTMDDEDGDENGGTAKRRRRVRIQPVKKIIDFSGSSEDSEESDASSNEAQTPKPSGRASSNMTNQRGESNQRTKWCSKKQYCLYCRKPYIKLARHLRSVHFAEPEVAKAFSHTKYSEERKSLLVLIRNKGNFLHNTEVARTGKGVLVPCKRTSSLTSADNFDYCKYCQGLYQRKDMWRHAVRCKHNVPGKEQDPAETSGSAVSPTAEPACSGSPSHRTGDHAALNLEQQCYPEAAQNQAESSCPTTESVDDASNGAPVRQTADPVVVSPDTPDNVSGLNGNDGVLRSLSSDDIFTNCDQTSHSEAEPSRGGADQSVECVGDEEPPPADAKPSEQLDEASPGKMDQRSDDDDDGKEVKSPKKLGESKDQDGETVSPNSKTYSCDHCNAVFHTSYNLRRHVYTHTGERPFWCSQCNVGFIQKYRLRKHKLVHHGDRPCRSEKQRRSTSSVDQKSQSNTSRQPLREGSGGKHSEATEYTEKRDASTSRD
ncbi:uncharacterized protein LOC115829780 [Chanos chanos]|uniref:Uncharacterized protein LOC115829780 n=1 Tax=Chanos chanos TaxID=29144 RepID=A0A6J2WZU7_CHACN|nr:uncharacterized protein LOC115829780 [Chanos chanos]